MIKTTIKPLSFVSPSFLLLVSTYTHYIPTNSLISFWYRWCHCTHQYPTWFYIKLDSTFSPLSHPNPRHISFFPNSLPHPQQTTYNNNPHTLLPTPSPSLFSFSTIFPHQINRATLHLHHTTTTTTSPLFLFRTPHFTPSFFWAYFFLSFFFVFHITCHQHPTTYTTNTTTQLSLSFLHFPALLLSSPLEQAFHHAPLPSFCTHVHLYFNPELVVFLHSPLHFSDPPLFPIFFSSTHPHVYSHTHTHLMYSSYSSPSFLNHLSHISTNITKLNTGNKKKTTLAHYSLNRLVDFCLNFWAIHFISTHVLHLDFLFQPFPPFGTRKTKHSWELFRWGKKTTRRVNTCKFLIKVHSPHNSSWCWHWSI